MKGKCIKMNMYDVIVSVDGVNSIVSVLALSEHAAKIIAKKQVKAELVNRREKVSVLGVVYTGKKLG